MGWCVAHLPHHLRQARQPDNTAIRLYPLARSCCGHGLSEGRLTVLCRGCRRRHAAIHMGIRDAVAMPACGTIHHRAYPHKRGAGHMLTGWAGQFIHNNTYQCNSRPRLGQWRQRNRSFYIKDRGCDPLDPICDTLSISRHRHGSGDSGQPRPAAATCLFHNACCGDTVNTSRIIRMKNAESRMSGIPQYAPTPRSDAYAQ